MRLGFNKFAVCILPLAAGTILTLSGTASSQTSDALLSSKPAQQIHMPLNDLELVALPGNVRLEANARNDLGAVDDNLLMEHMQLLLSRSPRQQRALDLYLAGLNDKASPIFHRWLTPAEFGARFGVAEADIEAISGWLAGHGLTVNAVYPNRMTLDMSGTAAQVRSAFKTEIHVYDLNGRLHLANDRDPQIPAALAPAVAGVVSLHDFEPRAQFSQRSGPTSGSTTTKDYPVTPPDLATIYNLNPAFKAGYTGKGQTIVVVGNSNVYSTADWTAFRRTFGLSAYTSGSLTQVHPGWNCANPGAIPGLDVEPILDAEYASAAAPGAVIQLATCASTATTFGGLIALQSVLNANSAPPAVISISFGECEALNGATANAAYNAAYQQAAAEGISVFVSAGDSGGAFCDSGLPAASMGQAVNALASTPYAVAVGGTDFSDTYSSTTASYWNSSGSSMSGLAKSYVPEIPWNDSCAGSLLAKSWGTSSPYGSRGFCNTAAGVENFLTTTAASGGASSCATGAPKLLGVTGGSCRGWAKPAWQSLFGNPKDGVRDLPDVALFAGDGLWNHYYLFCNSDFLDDDDYSPCAGSPSGWAQGGGTSFSAPFMAGIQALVDQKWGRQGNPNPIYYKIAAAEYGSNGNAGCNASKGNSINANCAFNDITQGDTDVDCIGSVNCYVPSGAYGVLSIGKSSSSLSYPATPGWDPATGIGSVNAYNLLMNPAW